jgi:hypothetical protein
VLELGLQLDALVGEKSPYTKHCAIVVSHNSFEITHCLVTWPLDPFVHPDGQANGCASMSSVTFVGVFVE